MKVALIFSVLFQCCFYSNAQEFSGGLSYSYFYSRQLDKCIQTYNFDRPFYKEKQPLFVNGVAANAGVYFKSSKALQCGIAIAYSFFQSTATNGNTTNQFRLHLLDISYTAHYHPEKWGSFYADAALSVATIGLFRRLNGEPFEYDDSRSKSLGIGGKLSVLSGYYLPLKGRHSLSAFLQLDYAPYIYAPKNEAVINNTMGLLTKDRTGMFAVQAGLRYHLKKVN